MDDWKLFEFASKVFDPEGYSLRTKITLFAQAYYDDYAKVKAALLRKYPLAAEALWQPFRQAKRGSESRTEFLCQLKCNLKEWMRSAEAYGNYDTMLDCIALEQF